VTWIDLEGAANVRDVGGLPTVDGRRTRPGVLLRADNLQDLTEGDVRRLVDELGVRTVLDLRSTGELHLTGPGPLRATGVVHHHHLSLIPEYMGESDEAEVDRAVDAAVPVRADRSARAGETRTDMTGYYIGYLEDAADKVGEALRVLADPDSGPTLVHCAAGKDRTGVVVALALSLVGVPRDAVVADYVRSAERVEAVLRRLQAAPTYADELRDATPDDLGPVAGSMERFLDHVDSAYGGPHVLAMALGVDEEGVARLGARLVGTSPHARRA
jgi:protein tyrosine/serine phosphatase